MYQCREEFMDSKVVDETWFIRIGCLWGLQVGGREKLSPENLLGCSFIIKGKVGMPGRTSLSFLSRRVLSSAPPVAQTVKRLPTMWETQVQPLGWEDPLEKKMATHSSTLDGKSHGLRSLVVQSMGSQRIRHDWATSLLHFLLQVGQGSFLVPT